MPVCRVNCEIPPPCIHSSWHICLDLLHIANHSRLEVLPQQEQGFGLSLVLTTYVPFDPHSPNKSIRVWLELLLCRS